ncbi:MAG: hypothetical protein KTR21_17470 [Rhodobacteraceae bacterium]|nr:hypothetical protein [Paracoccaceae bacterium]
MLRLVLIFIASVISATALAGVTATVMLSISGADMVEEEERASLTAPTDNGPAVHRWINSPHLTRMRSGEALTAVPQKPSNEFNPKIPYLKLELPLEYVSINEEAARGVDLATIDGCEQALISQFRFIAEDIDARRQARDVCKDISKRIRIHLRRSPETLHRVATEGWVFFRELVMSMCTPEEREMMMALAADAS